MAAQIYRTPGGAQIIADPSRAQGIGTAAAVQRGQDGVVRDVSPGTAYEEANLYDQYMAAMEERYNNMLEDIQRQQDVNISRIESQYGQAIAGLENQRPELLRRYEDTAKEAYLANMLAKRDLPQQLAAQGMTGGMTESAALALAADYQNQAGAARRDYDGYLTDLENQVNQARAAQAEAVANAGSSYDSLLADARNEYLANIAQYNLQKQIYADEQQQNRANLAWQKQQYEDEQALKNKQWEYQVGQDALNNQLAREQWEWQKAYNQQQADRDWDLNNRKLAASYSSGSGSSGAAGSSYLGDIGFYGDAGDSSSGNDQGWSYSTGNPVSGSAARGTGIGSGNFNRGAVNKVATTPNTDKGRAVNKGKTLLQSAPQRNTSKGGRVSNNQVSMLY